MARALAACLKRFRHADGATSAIEFAFICPVLLILMLAGFQLVTYIEATRRVERVAASAAQMISEAAPPAGSTTATAQPSDIHFAYDSGLVIFPYVMKDAPRQNQAWWQDLEIDFAGIQFTQIGSTCANPTNPSSCYQANVAWTTTTGTRARQCSALPAPAPSTLSPTSNTAATNRATLPSGTYGPGGLIVVDVYFTFHPTFASNFISPITIARSAYLKPRYANLIAMNFNGDSIVSECPGY